MRGKRPPSGEPVIDRALSLLAVFSADRRAVGLAELSRRSGLPRSTTLRLAARLVEWGALERDADGRYVVGLRLFEVASLAPRTHGVREVALPYLEDLHDVTRQHVLLAVRDGAQALLVERLSTHGAVDIAYRVGGRMPLRDTGVGLVLLAHTSEGTEPPELATRLAAIRRDGLAVFDRRLPAPVTSVAAPVRDASGAVVAAASVVVPAESAPPRAYEHAVAATARAVSRALGHDARPRR